MFHLAKTPLFIDCGISIFWLSFIHIVVEAIDKGAMYMKMKLLLIGMTALFTAMFALPTESEAKTEAQRFIALHDRILRFEEGEIRLVNAQMLVPLEKMAHYLYAEVAATTDQITVTKNGTAIFYDYKTNQTLINGVKETANPAQLIDEVLYIPIRFLGEETGFNVDYLSNILTARLFTSTHPHLSHPQFIQQVWAKHAAKPAVPATPAPTGKPVVYLTFDDGPNKSTAENLKTLKNYGVKGTFFFVGSQLSHFPELTRQAYAEGHYLALHSMSHDRNRLYASANAFMEEMQAEARLMKKTTGHSSILVRAPYGSSPYVTPAMRSALKNSGYKLWDWDVDTVDWKYQEKDYMKIVANAKAGVVKALQAKDQHIVVLLHDRPQTVKALPLIIKWLQQSGYSIQPYNPAFHITQNFGNHEGI